MGLIEAGETGGRVGDPIPAYSSIKTRLIEWAEYERWRGLSHRNPPFKVGCCLLVDIAKGPIFIDGGWGVYSAFNFTPSREERKGKEKRCAERNAVEDALADGCSSISAIVTVSSESSTGDGENKSSDVLHPCRDCRDMFRELKAKGILRGDSVVCNVNSSERVKGGEWIAEERTIDELLALYSDDNGKQCPQDLFYFTDYPIDRALQERIRVKKYLLDLRFTAMDRLD